MKTLISSALFAAACFVSSGASAEKIPLSDLSDYLNSLEMVEADFVQFHEDGSAASGRLLMKRPGRMRLEYGGLDAPLLMAAGGQFSVFDPSSNEPPLRFPLAPTPMAVILKKSVDLTDADMIVAHREIDGQTVVTAQDPKHADYGSIDLIFEETDAGPQLSAWVVYDQAGGVTEVILQSLQSVERIPEVLFNISREARLRGVPLD